MKKIGLIISFILCIVLTGCSKEEPIVYTEYTMREDGEPYSDWGRSSTGSAKYLDGDSLLVSIYVDEKISSWSYKEEENTRTNTRIACEYLEEQGRLYGKEVNLIYDTDIYTDLELRLEFDATNYGYTGDDADIYLDCLETAIYEFIHNDIDTKALMKKYQVNSVGYMVFVDDNNDTCTAYPYYEGNHEYYYPEFCIIHNRWSEGNPVEPRTYAHEILHLFGARDLYHTSEYTGIYKDFVLYADDNYGEDIMLGGYTKKQTYGNDIKAEVTKLTAYFIGWTEYIAELEKFPSIKSKEVASYCQTEHKKSNYEYYSLIEKADKVNTISDVVFAILLVLIIGKRIIDYVRNKKSKPQPDSYQIARHEEEYNKDITLDNMNKFYMMDLDTPSDEITDKISYEILDD